VGKGEKIQSSESSRDPGLCTTGNEESLEHLGVVVVVTQSDLERSIVTNQAGYLQFFVVICISLFELPCS
jgi:hypothetical protein